MRSLLASTAVGALLLMTGSSGGAETVISTGITIPISTSTSGDIRISSTGSLKPTSSAAVTIDSNNSVKNEGAIAIKGANDATGILANANLAGDVTNSGTITIDEDYTPADDDNDGDVDGPFAQGSNRFGIHVLSGGDFAGNVLNSGTITIKGNDSAGIAIDSSLAGSLTSTGSVRVLGDDSVGIRAGAVSGDVTIGSGSSTTAQGQNSVGVLLGGDIGGALVIQGSVVSTAYRSTSAPADTSSLDSDDVLQGGPAVVVSGSVGGGILLGKAADNSSETSASIVTYGSAPAMVIGSATQDIDIGAVASSALGHGLVIEGSVGGSGLYDGISATGLSIGGTGHAVNIAGGMSLTGAVTATASKAAATAVHVGAGAIVPEMVVGGTIVATSGGSDGSAATAILIDSGASVKEISNSGVIAATRSGDLGTASAIVDRSGTLSLVQNSGQIGVTNSDSVTAATAIDLRADSAGAVIRQVAAASGRPAPLISGAIDLGSGNDTLDLEAGSVLGSVDFGGGSDTMSLSGSSLFRGTLANSSGLAVTIGSGSTFDAQNLGPINLASLSAAGGSLVGVTIGEGGHTLYNVAGTADFSSGSKILVTIDHVGTAAGTYTIIHAGTLNGADNLSSSIVTLPFLFNSKLSSDAGSGNVTLDIERKDSGSLGLNRSEAAIVDAVLDAADSDKGISAVFLSVADSATLKDTLQQMMPDYAGGAFETATKGSRLGGEILSDPRPVSGLWLQQLAWGSSKSIGKTSSYDLTGWGATGGYDIPLGKFASFGVTAAYLWGKDGHHSNELISDHYEAGIYVRTGVGPLRAWARATAGRISFENKRYLSASAGGNLVTRTANGAWKGTLYSATGGLSFETRLGDFSIRPTASIEYYKLDENGYTETGGGDAFDLTVESRSSHELAASALVSIGYDLFGRSTDEDSWARIELEGGRREIFNGKLGDTIASFKNGNPFTLTPEERTSGWRGGLRLTGGGSGLTFVGEVNAEQQQGDVSLGARAGLTLGF